MYIIFVDMLERKLVVKKIHYDTDLRGHNVTIMVYPVPPTHLHPS